MSEDNGTYILILKDGYRVSQLHAVQNLLKNIDHVISAYDEKITWDTKNKAVNYAFTLEVECPTEYGVWYIEDYETLTWKDLLECHGSQLLRKKTALGVLEQSKNSPTAT